MYPGTSETVSMSPVKCIRPSVCSEVSKPTNPEVSKPQKLGGGGQTVVCPPPLSKYEIIDLETSEHTESRVHFTGLTEGVSDVSGYIWGVWHDFLTSDLLVRQPNHVVRQPNFVKMSVGEL